MKDGNCMAKLQKKKRRKMTKRQKRRKINKLLKLGFAILCLIAVVIGMIKLVKPELLSWKYFERSGGEIDASKPDIDVQLLTVNPYSRPGIETGKIKGIVVHYTANPGASAQANRDYFENLKSTHETKSSSNFIIGLDGEIIQCVPTWEVAYASNDRNKDTVSIECCHPDESGKFTKETYRSLVKLCAWLCLKFDLNEEEVIRHYDVTGKNCPKYFVEDEEAFFGFREDIASTLANTE